MRSVPARQPKQQNQLKHSVNKTRNYTESTVYITMKRIETVKDHTRMI
jgi:hypothetical protein